VNQDKIIHPCPTALVFAAVADMGNAPDGCHGLVADSFRQVRLGEGPDPGELRRPEAHQLRA